MQWLRLQQDLTDLASYGVQPPEGCSSHSLCPACHKTTHGVVYDSCLGLVRFRNAAKSSHHVQPALVDSRMLSDEAVQSKLQSQRGFNFEQADCSSHTAASVRGRRSEHFHVHGLAAGVCRHEILLNCCKLFSSENFSYYELLLEELVRRLDSEGERRLDYMYLDIACQFVKWWAR